jgi:lysophospholipid acyltransferase (LPLAT)-like uncharacterized protein
MLSWRRLSRKRWVQTVVATLVTDYLRFVAVTNRLVIEPADIYERVAPELPVILAMWHGQHFLMPFAQRKGYRGKVLISHHRDGELNALVAERLEIGTIRGSGHHGEGWHKGGVAAFMGMLRALEEGYNMALTADVPKVARVAGLGIVKLAQASGRPIYPVAIATSRRKVLDNWDQTTINLPFGTCAAVIGEPVHVARDADAAALEAARQTIEASLNAATARAYEITDGRSGAPARG